MTEATLRREVWLDHNIDDVFEFFANAANLERLPSAPANLLTEVGIDERVTVQASQGACAGNQRWPVRKLYGHR